MSTASQKTPANVSSSSKVNHEHPENKDEEDKNQTCRHYMNNTCKFGISGKGCPYVHPKRCSKLMNHGTRAGKGCNKGKKCKDFHPKMCPMSIAKSECFDLSCSLCHVKGTRRRPSPKPVKPDKVGSKEEEESKDTAKAEACSAKPTADNRSPMKNDTTEGESFLGQISLLKKELQEAMDKKLESLLTHMQSKQTSQQMPQLPFQLAPTQQQFAPIPWMHPFYQMQRNPMFPMGY